MALITDYRQVCVQLPASADDVALPVFATECRAAMIDLSLAGPTAANRCAQLSYAEQLGAVS